MVSSSFCCFNVFVLFDILPLVFHTSFGFEKTSFVPICSFPRTVCFLCQVTHFRFSLSVSFQVMSFCFKWLTCGHSWPLEWLRVTAFSKTSWPLNVFLVSPRKPSRPASCRHVTFFEPVYMVSNFPGAPLDAKAASRVASGIPVFCKPFASCIFALQHSDRFLHRMATLRFCTTELPPHRHHRLHRLGHLKGGCSNEERWTWWKRWSQNNSY